ncbi:MAG: ROK family protein [Rectinemataceae bacterium]
MTSSSGGKPRNLKRNNRKLVLELFRSQKLLSVSDVSERISLSIVTVWKIIDHYVAKGLLKPAGKGSSSGEGGKRPALFRFNESYGFAIGVHLFPDELLTVITDLSATILHQVSWSIAEDEPLEHLLDLVADSVKGLIQFPDVDPKSLIGMAFGSHGITDSDKGLSLSSPHFPSWGKNAKIREPLAARLGIDMPIFVDNQIRFQVYAERLKGLAKDKRTIIVLEAGVGLVAGVMVNDEIKRGEHYLAGEVGHMIINPSEELKCACGGRGCFEVMVSKKRVLDRVWAEAVAHPESPLAAPGWATFQSVFDASNKGDPFAMEIVEESVRWFSIGLSNIILMYDPEIIIIQGEYAGAGEFFLSRLRSVIADVSLCAIDKHVQIAYSTLGRERGVIGAACYVIGQFFDNEEREESAT